MSRLAMTVLTSCLAACGGADASQMLAYDYVGDGVHVLAPVPLGPVTDPVHMVTDAGDAVRGGRLRIQGDAFVISPGARVRLEHVVRDDVFVPLDEQGLVLASFFHHLGTAADDLRSRGHGDTVDALLPVDAVMWSPTFIGELGAAENAAFITVPGFDGFILYNDANDAVPLAAHAGVVRHELGHGFLSKYLDAYSAEGSEELAEDGILETFQARALNEGFADMLSLLTLDDPDAIPFGSDRDPRQARNINDVVGGDPYSVGVVLAALAWDTRIVLDDAALTFELVLDALDEWEVRLLAGDLDPDWPSLSFGAVLVDVVLAARPDATDLCPLYEARFNAPANPCS